MKSDSNSLAHLLDQLSTTPDLPLLFSLDGVEIGNGYHVTEIKLAEIKSVDCGNGNDAWQEIIIQLLDGASAQPAMTCNKFQQIMNKAQANLQVSAKSRFFIEFSPANGYLQRSQVQAISNQTHSVLVELGGSKAECKPFTRALANSTASCCDGESMATQSSCCGESPSPTQRSCC